MIRLKPYVVRPIATIGLTYMIALAAANFLPLAFSVSFGVICAAITLVVSCIKPLRSQRLILILLTAGIAFGCYSLYTVFNYNPARNLDGKTGNGSGQILDISSSQSGKTVYTVRLDNNVLHTPIPVKINLYLDEAINVTVSDYLYFKASFYLPSEEFGTAAPLQSAKSDGIFLYANGNSADTTIVKTKGFQLSRIFYDLKTILKSKIHTFFYGEDAAIFQAMLLGDKSEISRKTNRDFVRTGILHVMVVSGLHLVVLSQFLIRSMKALHIKRKPRYLAAMLSIPVIMAISGFTSSINRAGFMLLLFYAAKLFDRSSDSITSLALAGLLFTLFSPYLVTDLSFQLTYLSTLGIILLSEKLSSYVTENLRLKSGFLRWAADLICMTFSVNLFIFPISLYHFKGFSLLSPVFNLLLSPLFSAILILGTVFLFSSFFPFLLEITNLFASVLSALLQVVRGIASFCSELSFSYIPLGFRFVYFWMIASILLFGFTVCFCTFRYKYQILSGICAGLFLIASLFHAGTYRDILTVALCKQGKDHAVLFIYQDQMIMLGCNDIALNLTETNGISKIPFVLTDNFLPALAETASHYQVDTLCTDSIVPENTINCREKCAPADWSITFTIPLEMHMKKIEKNVYCAVKYGNFNFIYGSYDQHLESLYQENLENIYILVNDCNSVFQKPVKYAIMLNDVSDNLQKANPLVTFIDGSGQGITPVRVRQTGEIKAKGAGQWLY